MAEYNARAMIQTESHFAHRTNKFLVTSGADGMIKVWDLASVLSSSFSKSKMNEQKAIPSMKVTAGALVHSKDVNTVAISPNDLLICTGSQDKTAKV